MISSWMGAHPAQAIAGLLIGLAAIAAILRELRRGGWRQIAVWGQLPVAVLFYLLLFPPLTEQQGDALTVLTPGISESQRKGLPAAQPVVTLPDATGPARAQPVPDLATALRRFPAVGRIDVVGAGLPARDRTAASTLALNFNAAPLVGLIELSAATTAPVGTQWSVAGKVAPGAGARVELRDPSGAVIDAALIGHDGRFRLSTVARGIGPVLFSLRVLDARAAPIDSISVPLWVRGGETLNIVLRAGGANAEVKYWRRWAADSGQRVAAIVGLTQDVSLRDGDASLSADALAKTDLVIVDERAWLLLGADEKAALSAAVEGGLGLLLRVEGDVDPAVVADWADLGFKLAPTAIQSVTLDQLLVSHDRATFAVAPVAVSAVDATPLWGADNGQMLSEWRSQGSGRIGLDRLVDSYRLSLLGDAGRYGNLWAGLFSTLARARPKPRSPILPDPAWVDQRTVLCGLATPDQPEVDPPKAVGGHASGATLLKVNARGCAAYWPDVAGWHRLHLPNGEWPFYVHADDDGLQLRRSLDSRATLALVNSRPVTGGTVVRASPVSRWPFFCAWLLAISCLWWLERRSF